MAAVLVAILPILSLGFAPIIPALAQFTRKATPFKRFPA
jgi:hypothetical protein